MRAHLIFLCSVFLSAIAFAEPITPEQARDSDGKVCEVKGLVITETRSGDNVYLNFGEAFPRQTFTVKYSRKSVANFELWQNLIGREIIVEGKVVTESSNGPRIVVQDLKQIKLLPVDEKSLLSKPSDGAIENKLYAVAWHQVLKRGDYETIEKQAAGFTKNEAKTADGLWQSVFFFEGLASPDDLSTESWQAAKDRLAEWRKKSPASITALHAEAEFFIEYAWQARGGEWAALVSRDQDVEFQARLKQAEILLAKIPEKERRPSYYMTVLKLALGQAWDKDRMFAAFRESQQRFPGFIQPGFVVGVFLLPRWYGEEGEWERWLDDETKPDSPANREAYTRVAWAMSSFYKSPGSENRLLDQTRITWPRLKAGFQEILKTTPGGWWNPNTFALFSALGDDRDGCAALLKQIEGHEAMAIWFSWNNHERTVAWANQTDETTPEPAFVPPADDVGKSD